MSFVSRFRAWLPMRRTTFRSSVAVTETPREMELRSLLTERDRQIESLELEIRKLQSTVKVQELELSLLVAVNQRNQQRVESETAEYTQRIAQASEPTRRA